MSERTYEITVRKSFPLVRGESIREATNALRAAAKTHFAQKLNKPEEKIGLFVVEVFSKAAIFDVYDHDKPGPLKFFAVSFTRKKKTYEFGPAVEVERLSSFAPVQKDAAGPADSLEMLEGWPVKKSLWDGVV